jgi:LacI family transcriptional regulator
MKNETLVKVQTIIRETKYTPNMGGRLLRNRSSRIIGVIVTWGRHAKQNVLQDPFFGEIIGALELEIHAMGYFMLFYTSHDSEETIRVAESWNVDGLIILGGKPDTCAFLMQNTETPMVFIDSYFTDDRFPYVNVGLQDRQGGRLMTEYLIQQGHRRIAFLADGNPPVGVDLERLLGYREALKAHNLPAKKDDYFILSQQEEDRHAFFRQFAVEKMKAYTTLFFASDFYAVDAITTFHDMGIQVPNDISVCGFDGNIYAAQCRPRLTTVKQSVPGKAVNAIAALGHMIRKEALEQPIMRLDVKLQSGDSVKPFSQ